jgi:hypothetical protein
MTERCPRSGTPNAHFKSRTPISCKNTCHISWGSPPPPPWRPFCPSAVHSPKSSLHLHNSYEYEHVVLYQKHISLSGRGGDRYCLTVLLRLPLQARNV